MRYSVVSITRTHERKLFFFGKRTQVSATKHMYEQRSFVCQGCLTKTVVDSCTGLAHAVSIFLSIHSGRARHFSCQNGNE